jgi:phytoene dehydrogenase-like protein
MAAAMDDAVVIGSGPNGLAAGITLAEHGRSVLLIEARDRLGGAVVTEPLTLPGFRHDVFSAVYPAAAASPVFARLPLARYGLRWVHPPVAMAHPFPDGRAAALYRDLNQTVDNLDRLHPGDGQRWRAFIGPYLRHGDALRHALLSAFPPIAGGARFVRAFGVERTLEFARTVLLAAATLGREIFRGDAAPAWLSGTAMHADVPPQEAGSAIAAVYLLLLGHLDGWPSPEGGAARLADALAAHFHACGGTSRTSATAVRIIVAHGCVRGVLTSDGEIYPAANVIADVTPHALLRIAGHALPTGYVRQMARYRYGPPTFKVDWALDRPTPWVAPEARSAGTVHIGGAAADLHAALAQQHAGVLPERPFLLFGQQSLADPTRAPAGKQTAWAYTHVPRGIDWSSETERFVARLEAHIERFAPGFRDRILARHVLTPAAFMARDANLVEGDVANGSTALDQLLFRPIPSLSPYRTPIRGLYLGSAATFPGAAVHGVSGDAAARLALRDRRRFMLRRP